jgi:hypothetical protein
VQPIGIGAKSIPSFSNTRCPLRAEFHFEIALLTILGRGSSPRPQAQVPLHDRAGRFLGRPDFYYPLDRLAVEYDGAHHRENLTGDNRRQNRLIDAGYRLLRFTAADVLSAPDSIVALVRRALSAK